MDTASVALIGALSVGAAGAAFWLAKDAWPKRRTPATPIDWTKPLEHVDGTPLTFTYDGTPDDAGDYYLRREDGLDFTPNQNPGASPSLIVDGCGMDWLAGHRTQGRGLRPAHGSQLVRNRAVAANTNLPPLSLEQRLVLHAMHGEWGISAKSIAADTGLTVERVNAARRELRQLGLASYGPLYDEDGAGVRGSGYVLTDEGVNAREALRASLQVAA